MQISVGDILREQVKNNTPIGSKAKSYMDSGQLVSSPCRCSRSLSCRVVLLAQHARFNAYLSCFHVRHWPSNVCAPYACPSCDASQVPDDVVVEMVKSRLGMGDCAQRGWLLDGYPRSGSQAEAIEKEGIRPDVFLLIEVGG